MLADPTIVTALVSGVVAFVISGITSWVSYLLQKERLRTELKLEFAAETAIRDLLSEKDWKLRSFEAINCRLQGFETNELRKLLIRSGALCFERRSNGEEMWGLRERNRNARR
jgi:hypothetical protein